MHLPMDYPRINQFPEWFTVEPNDRLSVAMGGKRQIHTGKELTTGLEVKLDAGETLQLTVAGDQ